MLGQTAGRAINLIFDLGDGQLLYGVGTLEYDLVVCTGQMGGPLVGPEPGDFGDWARATPPLPPTQTALPPA